MKQLAFVLIAAAALAQAANTPDISGHWQLNMPRSDFGKGSKPASMDLVVTRKGEAFHAVQTTEDPMHGAVSLEGDWFLDGAFHPIDNSAMTQMSRWDGQTLHAEKKNGNGRVLETVQLNLSPDGHTATERVESKTTAGTNTITLVWVRK